MFRHILYYVTSVLLLLHPYVCYSTDYKPDKETEKRIEALLGKMTLEEKIGQMNQLTERTSHTLKPKHARAE